MAAPGGFDQVNPGTDHREGFGDQLAAVNAPGLTVAENVDAVQQGASEQDILAENQPGVTAFDHVTSTVHSEGVEPYVMAVTGTATCEIGQAVVHDAWANEVQHMGSTGRLPPAAYFV